MTYITPEGLSLDQMMGIERGEYSKASPRELAKHLVDYYEFLSADYWSLDGRQRFEQITRPYTQLLVSTWVHGDLTGDDMAAWFDEIEARELTLPYQELIGTLDPLEQPNQKAQKIKDIWESLQKEVYPDYSSWNKDLSEQWATFEEPFAMMITEAWLREKINTETFKTWVLNFKR